MRIERLPPELTSGDGVDWIETVPLYAAPDFQVHYQFVSGKQRWSIESTADGSDHVLAIPGEKSGDLIPGVYSWQRQVIQASDGERLTIGRGRIEVLPNFAELDSGDFRSWAEIALENVEAVLAKKATADQASYSINGRSLSRYSIVDLTDLRDYLRREVARLRRRERQKRGKSAGRKVRGTFRSGIV